MGGEDFILAPPVVIELDGRPLASQPLPSLGAENLQAGRGVLQSELDGAVPGQHHTNHQMTNKQTKLSYFGLFLSSVFLPMKLANRILKTNMKLNGKKLKIEKSI